jgi:hypothetical protein
VAQEASVPAFGPALVAIDRETLVVGAFASLMVAGTVVAWSALTLLWRERRRHRVRRPDDEFPPGRGIPS